MYEVKIYVNNGIVNETIYRQPSITFKLGISRYWQIGNNSFYIYEFCKATSRLA